MANTAGSPPAKQPTVTLKILAAQIAEQHELSKQQSEALLTDMVELVVEHLKQGNRLRIGGLGVWQVRKREARMGRNPATGAPVQIKASKKVAFRAARELKEAIAGDETAPASGSGSAP